MEVFFLEFGSKDDNIGIFNECRQIVTQVIPFLIKIYGRSIINEDIFISAFYVNIIFEANEQLKPIINAIYVNT